MVSLLVLVLVLLIFSLKDDLSRWSLKNAYMKVEDACHEEEIEYTYYTVSEAEKQTLDKTSFWNREDIDWEKEFPSLSNSQIEKVRKLVQWTTPITPFGPKDCREYLIQYQEAGQEDVKSIMEALPVDWNHEALRYLLWRLDSAFFSQTQVEEELQEEGYNREQIAYAMEHCGVDWQGQADGALQIHAIDAGESERQMLRRMVAWGYTEQQARAAIDKAKVDFNRQALIAAEFIQITNKKCQHRVEMCRELLSYGFTREQAEYAVDQLHYN